MNQVFLECNALVMPWKKIFYGYFELQRYIATSVREWYINVQYLPGEWYNVGNIKQRCHYKSANSSVYRKLSSAMESNFYSAQIGKYVVGILPVRCYINSVAYYFRNFNKSSIVWHVSWTLWIEIDTSERPLATFFWFAIIIIVEGACNQEFTCCAVWPQFTFNMSDDWGECFLQTSHVVTWRRINMAYWIYCGMF